MAANANNYVDGAVLALPAGWTKQADHPSQANNACVYIWTGLGKATAGQTITVSNTGTTSNFTVYAVWLNTGGKDIAIVGTGGGRSGTSSANTVIPGITTTAARQSVIMVATERTTATGTAVNSVSGVNPTPVQDYYFENTTSTANSFLVEHFTQNAAGATGNATVTYSGGSGNGFGMMFGITSATPAPKISTLSDDFTTQDNTKWVYAAAASVSGGRLSTTPNTSFTGNVNSAIAYDLTESSVYVQVPQTTNLGNGHTETFIQLFDTGTNLTSKNSLLIDYLGGNLTMQYRDSAGTSVNLATVTYSATTHAWWRIRAASGTVYWDTSPDGFTWTQQASWAATIPLTSMKVILGSGYTGTEPSPGTALFDNFNVPAVGAAMTTLTDNFATKDTNKWFWSGGAANVSGQVSIPVTTAYDGIISNSFYNLTNSSSTVQVAQAPNIGNGSTELQYILRVDDTAAVFWAISNGYATCYTKSAGVTTQRATMPYNPKTHKYLRIAHDGTNINFQYSYTGNAWVTLYAWAPTIAITGLQVYLIAGYWSTETSPGTAIYDNYNIVPADPAQTVYNGTTEIASTLTVYNGTTEIAVVKTEIMRPGTSVTKMLTATPQNPFFVAHRGGSADWAEHSQRGNTQSVYLNIDAIEISLSRTSDGVWFGLHDQYLNRTSPSAPANYDPSAHTWAEVSAYTCAAPSGGDATFGAQPYCKLTDALTAYASTHVIFLDPKYVSSTYYTELLNIMDANGGTDRFIAKFAGGGEQWSVAAKARSYKSWGYFYAADVDSAALNSTTAAKYDFLGMEYNVAASYWTTAKSYGKPVIAHIAPNAAGATSGLSQGAVGVMCSGVRSVMASYRP
jgi:hypothetical protein